MNEPNELPSQSPTDDLASAPSRSERERLVYRYQRMAMRRSNLLAGGLGVLNGDFMLLTQRLMEIVLADGAEDRLPARAELALKCMRQVERSARAEHEMDADDSRNASVSN